MGPKEYEDAALAALEVEMTSGPQSDLRNLVAALVYALLAVAAASRE